MRVETWEELREPCGIGSKVRHCSNAYDAVWVTAEYIFS